MVTLPLINRIEAVQCHAAHFILNNYERYSSVSIMLSQLKLPPLAARRTCNHIIMMYKIINNAMYIPVEPPFNTQGLEITALNSINYQQESIPIQTASSLTPSNTGTTFPYQL